VHSEPKYFVFISCYFSVLGGIQQSSFNFTSLEDGESLRMGCADGSAIKLIDAVVGFYVIPLSESVPDSPRGRYDDSDVRTTRRGMSIHCSPHSFH
jgi:hypothetical protein